MPFGTSDSESDVVYILSSRTRPYNYLLASGKYTEPCNSISYDELLGDAPSSSFGLGGPLSREPQFPALDNLLSYLLATWLQRPYTSSSSCFRLAVWIQSTKPAGMRP
jgi:hypothetical protein